MRDYGKVFSRIWESTDFRSLSEDGRALVLYLLTCQHGTIAGVFRVPDGYACEDLQWTPERVAEGFANLHTKGFATRCEDTKWVWVTKFLEWNPPENPNQRKAAAKVIASVPAQCGWKPDFMRVCGPSLGLEAPQFEATPANPSETVGERLPNQKQEQEQEQKQDTSGEGAAGAPPDDDPKLAGMTAPERRKTLAWRGAKSLLNEHGMPKDQTGTFLGALHREHKALGDDAFLGVLERAVLERPAGPEAWIKAAFQVASGQRQPANKQAALEASNDAVVQAALAKGRAHAGS